MKQTKKELNLSEDEYWTQWQKNRIKIRNSGKELDILHVAIIDEELAAVRDALEANGINYSVDFNIISNNMTAEAIRRIYGHTKNTHITSNDSNSKKFKEELNDIFAKYDTKIYGIDYLVISLRAREYSTNSKNYSVLDKKLEHMCREMEYFIIKFNFPTNVDIEFAGDLKYIENNNKIITKANQLGYNLKIIPYSYADYKHAYNERRWILSLQHKELKFKYNMKIGLDDVDKSELNYKNDLVPDELVPERFFAPDFVLKYNKEMQDKHNGKRCYRPGLVSDKKNLYPGQCTRVYHTAAISETYVKSQNRYSEYLKDKQPRLPTIDELAYWTGWPKEYQDIINAICNDKAAQRIFMGGMCYEFITNHIQHLFGNCVKHNGKLFDENIKCLRFKLFTDTNFCLSTYQRCNCKKSPKIGGNVAWPKLSLPQELKSKKEQAKQLF